MTIDNTSSTALRPPIDYPINNSSDQKLTINWRNFFNQLWLFFNFSYRGNVPVLPPYTSDERDAIVNVVNGMVIYNTDLGSAQYYKAGTWTSF